MIDGMSTTTRTFAVIPAFRAATTLRAVVEQTLAVVDHVVVVDDACPERCGETISDLSLTKWVTLITRTRNGGVGAATKDGIAEAMRRGADTIVKVDADGQMDTRFVPHMVAFLQEQPEIELVKGNRFTDPSTLHRMPVGRLIGNAGLSFLVKLSSGFWTIVDPTNGFVAIRAATLRQIDVAALADDYFFEIDLLCALGLGRRAIAEMSMPAIYGEEHSSLSITRALFTFPGRLAIHFFRRILVNYLVADINVGSLCAAFGIPLLLAGTIFGSHEWIESLASGQPRPTGIIVLALLLFMLGFQLSLQAVFYDVQFAPRTVKIRRDPNDSVQKSSGSQEMFLMS
jgi:dolichol-phosphate mannosyltransferase